MVVYFACYYCVFLGSKSELFEVVDPRNICTFNRGLVDLSLMRLKASIAMKVVHFLRPFSSAQ
jgi:hypothetical protein